MTELELVERDSERGWFIGYNHTREERREEQHTKSPLPECYLLPVVRAVLVVQLSVLLVQEMRDTVC